MEKYSIDKSKILVLNLATDTKIFRPLENISLKKKDKFIVMYCGIFSSNYDFDIILDAAEITKNENIVYVLAGAGELENYLLQEINKRRLKNVVLEKPVKEIGDLVKKINFADVLILGMKNNLQANTAHPSKIFEFMACGKPVISSCDGAVRDILVKSKGGIAIETGNSKKFVDAIIDLYNSPEKRKFLGERGLEYILRNHSLEVFQSNLNIILSKLD